MVAPSWCACQWPISPRDPTGVVEGPPLCVSRTVGRSSTCERGRKRYCPPQRRTFPRLNPRSLRPATHEPRHTVPLSPSNAAPETGQPARPESLRTARTLIVASSPNCCRSPIKPTNNGRDPTCLSALVARVAKPSVNCVASCAERFRRPHGDLQACKCSISIPTRSRLRGVATR